MAGFLKQAFLEMFLSPTQCLKSAFLGTMANTARSFSSLSQHAMGPRHFPFQQVLFLLGFNTECSATLLNSCRCREELRNRGLSTATSTFQREFVYSHYQKLAATEVGLEEFWGVKKWSYISFSKLLSTDEQKPFLSRKKAPLDPLSLEWMLRFCEIFQWWW